MPVKHKIKKTNKQKKIPVKHKGSRADVSCLQELTRPVQEEHSQGLYQSRYVILESLPIRNLFISERNNVQDYLAP